MKELGSFEAVAVPSTASDGKPLTSVEFKKLINEVQQDQWCGCTNIERATGARAELFSRLRFPLSSSGKPVKL